MTREAPEPQLVERVVEAVPGVRRARAGRSPEGSLWIRVLVLPEHCDAEVRRGILAALVGDLGLAPEEVALDILSPPVGPGRRRLTSLTTTRRGRRFSATVALERAGDVLVGEAEGCGGRGTGQATVAAAVLDALARLFDSEVRCERVELLHVGGEAVAVVIVTVGPQRLCGSAPVVLDDLDAVARATLDAVNRLVEGLRGAEASAQLSGSARV